MLAANAKYGTIVVYGLDQSMPIQLDCIITIIINAVKYISKKPNSNPNP